jgi:hypothetical protein
LSNLGKNRLKIVGIMAKKSSFLIFYDTMRINLINFPKREYMVSINTEGIVESEKQQAVIQTWAEKIAEQRISRVFLNAVVQNIDSFITELVDERVLHMSDSAFFKKDETLLNQLADVDANVSQLGIQTKEHNSFAEVVIFYLSVKAAINCAVNAQSKLN